MRIGAINPNVFQDQWYNNGSLGGPDSEVRETALSHILDSVEIQNATGDLSTPLRSLTDECYWRTGGYAAVLDLRAGLQDSTGSSMQTSQFR